MSNTTIPLARPSDPDTSFQAPSHEELTELQNMVLGIFIWAGTGLTDSELGAKFPKVYPDRHTHPETPRKRRSDLTSLGFLKDSGERRKNRYGKNEVVWAVS